MSRKARRQERSRLAKQEISNAQFEPTIIIEFTHKTSIMSSGQQRERKQKYLITENLLCLPIYGSLESQYKDLDKHENGLELFMANELHPNGEQNEEDRPKTDYKLILKKKAISRADQKYGHSKVYIENIIKFAAT